MKFNNLYDKYNQNSNSRNLVRKKSLRKSNVKSLNQEDNSKNENISPSKKANESKENVFVSSKNDIKSVCDFYNDPVKTTTKTDIKPHSNGPIDQCLDLRESDLYVSCSISSPDMNRFKKKYSKPNDNERAIENEQIESKEKTKSQSEDSIKPDENKILEETFTKKKQKRNSSVKGYLLRQKEFKIEDDNDETSKKESPKKRNCNKKSGKLSNSDEEESDKNPKKRNFGRSSSKLSVRVRPKNRKSRKVYEEYVPTPRQRNIVFVEFPSFTKCYNRCF